MAEKGGLNSLLSYRFVKRPSAKLSHGGEGSSEDAVNGKTDNGAAGDQSQLSGGSISSQVLPDSSGTCKSLDDQ